MLNTLTYLFILSIIMSALSSKVKLTYFNIEGAGEKVRLALKCAGIPFEDNRVSFGEFFAFSRFCCPSFPPAN